MNTPKNAARVAVKAAALPAHSEVWDIEDMANEALSIGLAVDWIVQANTLLDQIQLAVKTCPGLGKLLREYSIPISSADWMACEMDQHINRILVRQHVLIKSMAGGAV